MMERAMLHDEEGAVSWSYTDVNSSSSGGGTLCIMGPRWIVLA
jgi:hypothetical protein